MSSIDQMGVELGKVLAKNILAQLNTPEDVTGHDSSVCDARPSFSGTDSCYRQPASSTTIRNTGRNRLPKDNKESMNGNCRRSRLTLRL